MQSATSHITHIPAPCEQGPDPAGWSFSHRCTHHPKGQVTPVRTVNEGRRVLTRSRDSCRLSLGHRARENHACIFC